MITDIMTGEVDLADVCFLVAVVLFVVAAVASTGRTAATGWMMVIGWVGLAFTAFGLLAL